jgi:hypothetical protein
MLPHNSFFATFLNMSYYEIIKIDIVLPFLLSFILLSIKLIAVCLLRCYVRIHGNPLHPPHGGALSVQVTLLTNRCLVCLLVGSSCYLNVLPACTSRLPHSRSYIGLTQYAEHCISPQAFATHNTIPKHLTTI